MKTIPKGQVEKDLKVLDDLLGRLKAGSLQAEELLNKGKLSHKGLKGLGFGSERSTIYANPELYQKFRLLKIQVEGLPEPISQAEATVRYGGLIARIQATGATNTSELSEVDSKLYRECISCPHWPVVKVVSLPTLGRNKNNYFYWTDDDLVAEAGKFQNLTQLKNLASTLHRELSGRDLLWQVQQQHPSYSTGCYIGLRGKCYRSQGELVLGNLIVLSGVENEWEWQARTGLHRNKSNKPMSADFLLSSRKLYIEISMFCENARGSRGKFYESRRAEKMEIYEREGCACIFIDSSDFYKQGVIDGEKFALHCITLLQDAGYSGLNGSFASSPKIIFSEGVNPRPDLTSEDYLDYLEDLHGLTCSSQLSNDKSYLNHAINLRDDSDVIRALLKQRGIKIGAEKISGRHRERRKTLAPFEEVREFARSQNFRNQGEWFAFCKENREFRKQKNFASNMPAVYQNLGWTNWYDFLGNQPPRRN